MKKFLVSYVIPSGLKGSAGYYYPTIGITDVIKADNKEEVGILLRCEYPVITEIQFIIEVR